MKIDPYCKRRNCAH